MLSLNAISEVGASAPSKLDDWEVVTKALNNGGGSPDSIYQPPGVASPGEGSIKSQARSFLVITNPQQQPRQLEYE